LHIPPYVKDVVALRCETIVFQTSHKLQSTVLVFMN